MSRRKVRDWIKEYEEAYRAGYWSGGTIGHSLALRMIQEMRPRGEGHFSALDIGCGRGLLLDELKAWRGKIIGTEIVPWLFTHDLKRKPALLAAIGEERKFLKDQSFDFVIFCDVLDHVFDKKDIRQALSFAKEKAKVGIVITLGSKSQMRTINWWIDKWEDLIKKIVPEGSIRVFRNSKQEKEYGFFVDMRQA